MVTRETVVEYYFLDWSKSDIEKQTEDWFDQGMITHDPLDLIYEEIEIVEGSLGVSSLLINAYDFRRNRRRLYYYEIDPDISGVDNILRRRTEFQIDECIEEEPEDPFNVQISFRDEKNPVGVVLARMLYEFRPKELAKMLLPLHPTIFELQGMIGQISLIGRGIRIPKLDETKENWKTAFIELSVVLEKDKCDLIWYVHGVYD